MKECYVFDVDGTLANLSHRLHHIQKLPKDWDSFFAEVHNDKPITHILKLCAILGLSTPIIISTGRPERCRESTVAWLIKHNVGYVIHNMYMRKDGDHRPDYQIKYGILTQMELDGWNPIMAFDDRDQVVQMWRRNNIPCAQVAPGDF